MSEQANTPGVIELPLTIDLNRHLARSHGYDPETDSEVSEPMTIEDLVIERAAQMVADRAIADAVRYDSVRGRAKKEVADLVASRIAIAVQAFIDEPRTPTDSWGKAKGEPVTFGEVVQNLVTETLTKNHTGDRYDRSKRAGTIVEQEVARAIEGTVAKEVQEAVKEQKDQILKQVTASAAAVLAEGVKRGIDKAERAS